MDFIFQNLEGKEDIDTCSCRVRFFFLLISSATNVKVSPAILAQERIMYNKSVSELLSKRVSSR